MLSVGDFYEVTGACLAKPAPGASAAKVRALFREARGSVVFIDEAYSLSPSRIGAAGAEAIAELIVQMEEYRDEVVVIFAGYDEEVKELFESNPGFASRVRAKIEFPDYSADELADIFRFMAERQELRVGEETWRKARAVCEKAATVDDFGNGRFARNLLENALLRQSSRLAALDGVPSEAELKELLPEDVEWDAPAPKRFVGFAA